jgi:hypothetical protein
MDRNPTKMVVRSRQRRCLLTRHPLPPLSQASPGKEGRASEEIGGRERLCSKSKVFWLPWRSVLHDCVEDNEEFSGDCNEDDHLWFAGIE